MKFLRQRAQRLLQLSAAHPVLKASMAALIRRILRRQLPPHWAPVRSIHNMPFRTARLSWGGRPRPSGRCGNRNNGFNTAPLLTRNLSASSHPRLAKIASATLLIPATPLKSQAKTPPQLFMRLVLMSMLVTCDRGQTAARK